MLGYCGINCDSCPAYRGTVTTNLELLASAVADYGKGRTSIEDWVCLGCTPADQPFLATYCANCKIRGCAVDRGVPNCAACDEFEACSVLRGFLATEPESLGRRMELLRARFVEASQ